MASGNTSSRVEPVFFLNSEVPQQEYKWLGTYEICKAVSAVIDEPTSTDTEKSVVDGAQKIGNLWRIYLLDAEASVTLLSNSITLRSQHVTLKNRNPFIIAGFEHVATTGLFIRNVPFCFDNEEIEKVLKAKGVHFAGSLKYSRARTPDKKLTNIKMAYRFIDIVVPDEPLPKKLQIGIFPAYHREQKQAKDEIECGNCMMKGHLRKDCKNEMVCYECRNVRHKKGDECCPNVQAMFNSDNEESLLDTSEVNDGKTDDIDEGESAEEEDQVEKREEGETVEKSVSQMIKEAFTQNKDENIQTPKI